MRVRLEIAAIFAAVGLGALAVTLLYDPMALVPHPPYGPWIFVRILALCSLASLGLLLVLGIEDDFDVDPPDRPIYWRVIGLAFLVSALASATFIAASALVEYLDRAIG